MSFECVECHKIFPNAHALSCHTSRENSKIKEEDRCGYKLKKKIGPNNPQVKHEIATAFSFNLLNLKNSSLRINTNIPPRTMILHPNNFDKLYMSSL